MTSKQKCSYCGRWHTHETCPGCGATEPADTWSAPQLITLPSDLSLPEYERAKAKLLDQLIDGSQQYWIARAGDVTIQPIPLEPQGRADGGHSSYCGFTRGEWAAGKRPAGWDSGKWDEPPAWFLGG